MADAPESALPNQRSLRAQGRNGCRFGKAGSTCYASWPGAAIDSRDLNSACDLRSDAGETDFGGARNPIRRA
jgi:hypothetical protein